MIYDCFMFFNELDVLEVRLNELYDTVDKFILVEADKTFTNQDKPLWFNENKERFSKFADKIEHIIIDTYPKFDSAWTFENYQRDVIIKTLKDRCNDEDAVIISDLDEIPRADLIRKYKNTDGIKVFEQKLYTFYFNYLNATEPDWKRGTRLLKFKDIQDKTLTDIRMAEGKYIKNAGWHFTYLGGFEMVKYKIQSFAHQEYNNEYYMNDKRLMNLIMDGMDIFERGYKYKIVNIDNTFPSFVVKNKEKYNHLVLNNIPVFHKIKNAVIKSKRHDKKYVDTINPINDNPVMDFISPTSAKILEIGISHGLKEKISSKFNIIDYINIDVRSLYPNESNNSYTSIEKLPDNYFDCVILDETLSQLYNPVEVLNKIKSKLNRNGYVVMVVPNIRNIKVLNQIIFKKDFKYQDTGVISNKNIRFFTRRSLFDTINKAGYFTITLKGLNPDNSLDYAVKNTLTFNNLYDCKHEKFLCVLKH